MLLQKIWANACICQHFFCGNTTICWHVSWKYHVSGIFEMFVVLVTFQWHLRDISRIVLCRLVDTMIFRWFIPSRPWWSLGLYGFVMALDTPITNFPNTALLKTDLLVTPGNWCSTHNLEKQIHDIIWLTTFVSTFGSLLRNMPRLTSWYYCQVNLDKYSQTSMTYSWTCILLCNKHYLLFDDDIYPASLL